MNNPDISKLIERIERLEALDQIRQLPAKYALCVDMRDLDSLVHLFIEDVGVSGKQKGRQALKRWYDQALRSPAVGSAHGVAGHIIDFESADLATGLVYSRNDLETKTTWMIEMMAYLDRYERRDGIWYFQRRSPLFWYECDITHPPIGPLKLRWEGREWQEGSFHDAFPTWREFWENADTYAEAPLNPPAPLNRFIETMRRGRDAPKVRPDVTR